MASDQELARRELARRQQEEADFFSQFANVPLLEEMLAIGTGAIAEPLSGLGALFAAPFVGSERAADLVGEFQEDLTYVPRGDRANANLQAVGEFLAPVGEAMDWAAENAGEGVYNLTGSPSAAALTEGLIQAAPDIAGLRFGGKLIDSVGDIGDQATGLGRREVGAVGGVKMDINEQLTEIVDNSGLSDFGVRVISATPEGELTSYKVGDYLPNSFNWEDGFSKDEIDGTSTIRIDWDGFDVTDIDDALEKLKPYESLGDQKVLVGGTSSYEGNDPFERVITDAQVLHVFE